MSRLPQHSPEFILCMGDDRTDEQMFQLVQQQQHIEKVCKCIVVVRYLCR
jgi:trehalose-6-phosphatase